MRYPASEKLEIIRNVEQSHLPVRRTLDKLGVLPGSFYRWYDHYQAGGIEALEDKPSKPTRVRNRIPDDVMSVLASVRPIANKPYVPRLISTPNSERFAAGSTCLLSLVISFTQYRHAKSLCIDHNRLYGPIAKPDFQVAVC